MPDDPMNTTATQTPVEVSAEVTMAPPDTVSATARDVALYACLGFFGILGVLSFWMYPVYEAGAAIVLNTLTGLIGFLLGTKSALASPKGGG